MTPLFILGTKINENEPNFVPRKNKGVASKLRRTMYLLEDYAGQVNLFKDANHYPFIYINYFDIFR